MKFHTNFWFLKDKEVIQPGKILIFGKKPEIFLILQLFGVGIVPLMQGFPNSVKGILPSGMGRIVNFTGRVDFLTGMMSDFDNSNLFQS